MLSTSLRVLLRRVESREQNAPWGWREKGGGQAQRDLRVRGGYEAPAEKRGSWYQLGGHTLQPDSHLVLPVISSP